MARRFGFICNLSCGPGRSFRKRSALQCRVLSYLFFDEDFFFEEDFFRGTLPPAFRASDNPIAIACFLLVTFLPERPLLRVPFFRSCIAFSTFSEAFLPYLAIVLSSFVRPSSAGQNQAVLCRGFPYKSRNSSLSASRRFRRAFESCFPARLM